MCIRDRICSSENCSYSDVQTDQDDVEREAKCHLRQHQEQTAVDVTDAELSQRLTPVHQTEYETHQLQQ